MSEKTTNTPQTTAPAGENATLPKTVEKQLPANQITNLVKEIQEEFLKANEGQDLDFVRMGSWLTITSKGQFVEKDDETINFGDVLDVVIGMGEQRFMLWGAKNSPEDGQMLVSATNQVEAEQTLMEFLETHPDAVERYTMDMIQSRHLIFVIPVSEFNPENPVETPIYLLALSPTAKIAYGHYTMAVFRGKFKANNVPARTGIKDVVTRISTVEKTNADKEKYLTFEYEALGLFNPNDFKK